MITRNLGRVKVRSETLDKPEWEQKFVEQLKKEGITILDRYMVYVLGGKQFDHVEEGSIIPFYDMWEERVVRLRFEKSPYGGD